VIGCLKIVEIYFSHELQPSSPPLGDTLKPSPFQGRLEGMPDDA
jgi:hypothetical protein